jgi:protein TonB
MAYPEELAPSLPDTLPEDFNEWDGGASPAPLPVNSNEWEAWEASHSFSKPSKPPAHSAERKTVVSPVIDRPRDRHPAPSAPASAKPQKDFARETSPVPLRVNSNEWETWAASFGRPAKPLSQSADRETIVSTAVGDPRRAQSGTVVLKQQIPATELVNQPSSHAAHAPEPSHAASEVAVAVAEPITTAVEEIEESAEAAPIVSPRISEQLFTSVALKNSEATEERGMSKKKKQIIVGATSACVILPALLLLIPLMHHGARAATKPVTETVPAATETVMQTETPDPASAPLTQNKPSAAGQKQQTPATQSANDATETGSAPAMTKAQAQMMNDQLSAPTRIPQNANRQMAENAPPPASFGADGLGGGVANVNMFGGHAQPVVRASGPVTISSGVATGLLIQRTPPVYPAIAKSARVAGTVQLHAIIAKNGTIKNLRVVSGPEMLRQAAVDAVRTWRYRPYKLDNEPAEVETTINVVFTLGG